MKKSKLNLLTNNKKINNKINNKLSKLIMKKLINNNNQNKALAFNQLKIPKAIKNNSNHNNNQNNKQHNKKIIKNIMPNLLVNKIHNNSNNNNNSKINKNYPHKFLNPPQICHLQINLQFPNWLKNISSLPPKIKLRQRILKKNYFFQILILHLK